MSVSIIISTYNGEETIKEQLQSIALQTIPPDEVLICDDASTDDTVTIIKEFITSRNLLNWRLIQNKKNAGWKSNFHDLLYLSKGDFIFPCDQDDIWHADKIEKMISVMKMNREIAVLEGQPHIWKSKSSDKCSFRSIVTGIFDRFDGKPQRSKNTLSVQKRAFDNRFMHTWPGCVLCIRKSFLESIKAYWISEIPHDTFVSVFANIAGAYYTLDYEVIEWRRHANSSTQTVKKTNHNRITEIERDKAILSTINDYVNETKHSECIKCVESAIMWNSLRYKFVKDGNLISGIRLLFYLPYYVLKRTYFSDVFYSMTNR